jgi:hypothetical protein
LSKAKVEAAEPAAPPPVEVNDLAGFDGLVRQQESGRECVIKHPATGDPLPFRINVHGKQSRRYKLALRWLATRHMAKDAVPADRSSDEDEAGFLARLCSGWTNCLLDGVEVPFSTEEAEKLFKRFPFIQEQVDQYAGDIGNFMDA